METIENAHGASPSHSRHLGELATALAKAQGAMQPPRFDGVNPHFENRYTTLHGIIECARKPLSDNGLSVVQLLGGQGRALTVKTMLLHASGQWMSTEMPVTFGRGDGPQAAGSGITYAKRYSYQALLGICGADDDDDGERAEGRATGAAPPPAEPKPKAKPKAKTKTKTKPVDVVVPERSNESVSRATFKEALAAFAAARTRDELQDAGALYRGRFEGRRHTEAFAAYQARMAELDDVPY